MKKLILMLIPLTFFGQKNNNLPIIDLDIASGWEEWEEGDDLPPFDVIPIFRPIGWNKEGEFAYQITKCDDMCGCCIDYICIRSVITDQVISQIDFGERGIGGDSINKVNILLSKYKIQKTGFGKLIRSDKINQYDIVFKQHEMTNYDSEYSVLVGNNKIGFKKVSKGLGNPEFVGYFKDPFENRILILFTSATWGEAETNWHTLHFVGCSLEETTF